MTLAEIRERVHPTDPETPREAPTPEQVDYLLSLIDRAKGIIREYRDCSFPGDDRAAEWLEEVGKK